MDGGARGEEWMSGVTGGRSPESSVGSGTHRAVPARMTRGRGGMRAAVGPQEGPVARTPLPGGFNISGRL